MDSLGSGRHGPRRDIDFVVCDDKPSLVWLAQMGALELHPSLSKVATMECPTVVAFDLDPGPPAAMRECCMVALRVRELFQDVGLESFAKTSGSKGVQVYVPLNGAETYDTTKPFSHAVAQALEKAEPALVVSRMTKSLRVGQGARGLEPEHPLQDDRGRLFPSRPRAADDLDARHVGTRSRRAPQETTELVFEAEDVLARIEEHGDLFAPCARARTIVARGRLRLKRARPPTPMEGR